MDQESEEPTVLTQYQFKEVQIKLVQIVSCITTLCNIHDKRMKGIFRFMHLQG